MTSRHLAAKLSALLIGFAFLPASSFAQLSFQSSQMPITSGFTVVAHGDFNGDAIEDLVAFDAVNYDGPDYLFLSNGDGTYRTPIKLMGLVQAIGDFNGDGKLDYATANSSGSSVTVYLGAGDGTFQAKTSGGGPEVPFLLLALDLNHDGKTDLVEVNLRYSNNNHIPSTLQVLISNGDGTFSKGQTIIAGTGSLAALQAHYAMTGDFDGDGKPDIALVYNNIPSTVQVFYGDGAGHLGSPSLTTDPHGYGDDAPIAADINNDGRSDIVSAADANGTLIPFLAIFTGNANRTLGYSTIATNECAGGNLDEYSVGAFAVADFNGDGLNDIAYAEASCKQVGGLSGTDIAIKLGEGAGKFAAERLVYQNLEPTDSPFAIKSTLSTKPDLVFSETENDGTSSALALLTNTSDGDFPSCRPSGFAEGVAVCVPGATAPSQVIFSVGAAGPTPMRTVQVWVDGKKTAEQLAHTFSNYSFLDASVPLAAGNHSITVFGTGWDGTLQEKKFTLTVNNGTSCSTPTSPGIHLCAPASGASVSSPVAIQAAAEITGKLSSMEVWIDGVKKYTESNSVMLSTSLSVAAGSHRFAVLVINTAGTKWEQAVTATVK